MDLLLLIFLERKTNLRVFVFGRFIFPNRFGKLVRARGVIAAFNPRQQRFDFVDIFPFDQFGYPLQVAPATADKAYVAQFIFLVDVEDDLTGTSPFRRIRKHFLPRY